MKKQILNLGKKLSKENQLEIKGGAPIVCSSNPLCPDYPNRMCIVIANRFCEFA